MKQAIAIGLAGMLLAGCATAPLTAEQCAGIDWHQLGRADGQSGQPMTALNNEITDCREHAIAPDMDAYNRGREAGLQSYCVPATLLEATVQSIGDPYVCQPFSADEQDAIDMGRETREAVARYQQVSAQFDQLVASRDQINAEGRDLSQRLDTETDPATREQIANRLGYLQGQIEAVEAEIYDARPIMDQEEMRYQNAVQTYETFRAKLMQ